MKKLITMLTLLLTVTAVQAQKGKIRTVGNARFAKIISDPNMQLIDVRTPAEFDAGHIFGAINVDFYGNEFMDEIDALDKTRPVAVYCKSGGRSMKVSVILSKNGLKVYNLKNGFMDWKSKNKEIEVTPIQQLSE